MLEIALMLAFVYLLVRCGNANGAKDKLLGERRNPWEGL